MNDKQRWPANIALPIANELIAQLQPRCQQICIAGSLRRRKAEVGDIEILYVPRMAQVRMPNELFPRTSSLVDELFDQWLAQDFIRKRPNINGDTTWGDKNKLAVHAPSWIPVDFFATTPDCWFVALVLRTGPKELNTRLAASALRRGMQLHAYGVLEVTATGELIIPRSEREVFQLLGVPYREPPQR
jgi:DNA polymerase/3'-5' exonuclease PolX